MVNRGSSWESAMAEAAPVFTTTPPKVRSVELDRPWRWLAAGWPHLFRAPQESLAYGVLFALAGSVITLGPFLGLIIIPPLIGHATWHGYRDLVEHAS
jgi:uncharacterized membrane protein